jgi:amino acid transporter
MKSETIPGTVVIQPAVKGQPRKNWRRWLVGTPLATADASHQTIGKLVGLAVFSSDAMSSVAYGPQEMMMILLAAGMGALPLTLPLAVVIVALLIILTFSYEQTIHAYPGGGGSYIVSRDNLGEFPALIAGASLLTDYILTVAVSISSGAAQIISAFPPVEPYKVEIAVVLILLVMVINLRGVKESGVTFAIPTYFFLGMMYLMAIVGLARYFTGNLGLVANPPPLEHDLTQPLTLFLILRAFANGTTSLTGVEAISNGITAFKEPRSDNAGKTLLWMAGIMSTLLLGISFLATQIQAIPAESETVISQLARTVFETRGIFYLSVITGTTLILILAANTAFADFPRLGALAALDGYLPRQLAYRGSRLVYSTGIVALALIASALVVLFQASVTGLMPLYAIGVFLSFTLSQAGMARRWHKSGKLAPGEEIQEPGSTLCFDHGWRHKMIINGIGAAATAFVVLIFAIFKFTEGAWIILALIPLLVGCFLMIHRHYRRLARTLSLENFRSAPRVARNRVVVLLAGVHRGSLAALTYARSLSNDVTAVHVSVDAQESQKVREKWAVYGDGVRLVVLESPYRLLIEPVMDYVERLLANRRKNEMVTIVVPQFVPGRWWENLLHNQTALLLRFTLMFKPGLVIVEVPYQV